MSELDLERDAQQESVQREVGQKITNDVNNNEEVKEYIARLNAEDKKRRLKLQEQLQKEREELQKQLDERDRLLAEKDLALQSVNKIAEKLDARAIAQQLKREAEREGLVDYDLLAFVDRSSVKVTDDGEVLGAREAILALKDKKSFAFRKPLTTIQPKSDDPPELSELLKPIEEKGQKIMSQSEFLASLGVFDAF